MDTKSFTATVEVSEERIENLLVGAFEGGIGYWACIFGYTLPPGVEQPEVAPYASVPLMEGGAVVLVERENMGRNGKVNKGTKHWKKLDREAIQRGINIMATKYPRHFGNFMDENDDAETADIFVQCAVLGEIVYG